MKIKGFITLFVLSLSSMSVNAQEALADTIIFYENIPVDSIFALSVKHNKPIMLDAYTTWCGPCKMMSRNTFKNKEVAHFYNKNFINVKLDMEKPYGREFNKLFPTGSYPTVYFINSDKTLMRVSKGYRVPEDFLQQGEYALNPELTPLYKSTQEYNAGNRDTTFLAAHIENIAKEYKSFNGEPQEYYTGITNKSLKDTNNFKVFYFGVQSGLDPWVETYIEELDVLTNSYGAQTMERKSIELINGSLQGIIISKDSLGLEMLIARAKGMMKNSKKFTPESIEAKLRQLYAQNVKN